MKIGPIILALGIGFFIGMFFAIYMDETFCTRPLEEEAVKRGMAEWKITTKETGREFKWKDKP